jgi:hypothetical protein
MTPETVLLILQYGIRYTPEIAITVQRILTKADPTVADIVAVLGACLAYDAREKEADVRGGRSPDAPNVFRDEPVVGAPAPV